MFLNFQKVFEIIFNVFIFTNDNFFILLAFRQAFSVFDRENRGCITSEDLLAVMKNLGQNPSHSEIQEMIREVDADGIFSFFIIITAMDVKYLLKYLIRATNISAYSNIYI